MVRILLSVLLLLSSVAMFAQTPNVLDVKEYRLKNGMTVLINADNSQAKVYGAVVVNAGAKDSPNTGIAHYFEHIMFKGTDKIGTINYEAEKVIPTGLLKNTTNFPALMMRSKERRYKKR